jgi:putative acetyltransferase
VSVCIQAESREDQDGIRAVHLAAFSTPLEADLVEALHAEGDAQISLVAKDEKGIVGHALLSRMNVEGDGRQYRALGLAPVAVLPDHQRQGIGSKLIDDALLEAQRFGTELVFVLGEPDYYRRFGFDAETAVPFASPYAGPYFMAKSLGAALPSAGTAEYAPAFKNLA